MAKPDKDAELRLVRDAAPRLEMRGDALYIAHKGLSTWVHPGVIVGATNVLPLSNGSGAVGLMETQWTTIVTDRGAQLIFPGLTPADVLEHVPRQVVPVVRPVA